MNKICKLIMVIFLIIVCLGCKDEKLDLQELYELNAELAQEYYIGHWLEDFKVKFYIFEAKKATEYETGLCTYSNINLEDVENVVYARFNEDIRSPQIIAVEYKSVELAKESMNSKEKIRKENILAVNMASGYILLYGDYKTVDGCSLSLDGESLLFEDHFDYRSDIIIPEGVKYVLFPGLMGIYAKTIKCNEELEIIYYGAFSLLPSLEKIELNDGLKEIGSVCFYYHNLEYIVIPKSVNKIGNNAFRNVILYCEATEKPSGWDDDFALVNCIVYWGGTWEYVDGVPQPIVSEAE